jgi:hypothetical protein
VVEDIELNEDEEAALDRVWASLPPYVSHESFAEWKPYTNPRDKRQGAISDGGRVVYGDLAAQYLKGKPDAPSQASTAAPTPTPTPATAKQKPTAKPTVDSTHEHIKALMSKPGLSAEDVGTLVSNITSLTKKDQIALRDRLGVKASGTKTVMAKKIAAAAMKPAADPGRVKELVGDLPARMGAMTPEQRTEVLNRAIQASKLPPKEFADFASQILGSPQKGTRPAIMAKIKQRVERLADSYAQTTGQGAKPSTAAGKHGTPAPFRSALASGAVAAAEAEGTARNWGKAIDAKPPHEMTKKEYDRLPLVYRGGPVPDEGHAFISNDDALAGVHGPVSSYRLQRGSSVAPDPEFTGELEAAGLEPHGLNSLFLAAGGSGIVHRDSLLPADHRSAVAAALAAGKPVPPEVLADYPDLATKKPAVNQATPTEPHSATLDVFNRAASGKAPPPEAIKASLAPLPKGELAATYAKMGFTGGDKLSKPKLIEKIEFAITQRAAMKSRSKRTQLPPEGKPAAAQAQTPQYIGGADASKRPELKTIADKKGKRYADALVSQSTRLLGSSSDSIHEYRSGGYVTKSPDGDKYTLHMVADTDGPARGWRIGGTIDVTDQYTNGQGKQ